MGGGKAVQLCIQHHVSSQPGCGRADIDRMLIKSADRTASGAESEDARGMRQTDLKEMSGGWKKGQKCNPPDRVHASIRRSVNV